jgi:hypothetical protein
VLAAGQGAFNSRSVKCSSVAVLGAICTVQACVCKSVVSELQAVIDEE